MCKFERQARGRRGIMYKFESKERGRYGTMWQFESKEVYKSLDFHSKSECTGWRKLGCGVGAYVVVRNVVGVGERFL